MSDEIWNCPAECPHCLWFSFWMMLFASCLWYLCRYILVAPCDVLLLSLLPVLSCSWWPLQALIYAVWEPQVYDYHHWCGCSSSLLSFFEMSWFVATASQLTSCCSGFQRFERRSHNFCILPRARYVKSICLPCLLVVISYPMQSSCPWCRIWDMPGTINSQLSVSVPLNRRKRYISRNSNAENNDTHRSNRRKFWCQY